MVGVDMATLDGEGLPGRLHGLRKSARVAILLEERPVPANVRVVRDIPGDAERVQ